MEFLGLDMWMEILSRLGVKDLIRLKSVSKTFFDLISKDDYIRLHLNKSSLRAIHLNKLPYLCLKQQGELSLRAIHINRDTYLDCLKQNGGEEVDEIETVSYGSCDGLVCLWPKHNNAGGVLLWNPALCRAECVPIKRPVETIYSCWFGYDNDEYKLILGTASHIHLIRLYIDTDSCKSSLNIDKRCSKFEIVGTLVHRTVHWPAYCHEDREYTIISYDLRNETVGMIATHDGMSIRRPFVLGQVDGCLSAMFATRVNLELWVMKEYGVQESWTKLMVLSKQFWYTYRCIATEPYDVELDDPAQLYSPIYGKHFYVESLIFPRSIKTTMW